VQSRRNEGEKSKPPQKLKKGLQRHQALQKGTSLAQVLLVPLILTPVLDPVLTLVEKENKGTERPAQIQHIPFSQHIV
jgi:hypothetical protein